LNSKCQYTVTYPIVSTRFRLVQDSPRANTAARAFTTIAGRWWRAIIHVGYVVNIGATRCTAPIARRGVAQSAALDGPALPVPALRREPARQAIQVPYCGQDFVYKVPLCGTTMNSTDTTCPNPACGHTFLTICPQMP